MYQFETYKLARNDLLKAMEETKDKIMELETFGINITESAQKIEKAKKIVENDKISIVLVGAFSDGKTSVAAGWLNEKLGNMKISSDESSDEILCYQPTSIPDGCQIVDTPGLFGDKDGVDENGEKIALSEKTRKYISEANLILYVVAAKNPIKGSQKDSIRWIMKDLNKLSSTIFAINRMDDVADLTDDEDYEMHAKIKSGNLRKKLVDCGANPSEANSAKIVCISADPDGRGIDFWKSHREEYLKRSRMDILEEYTNEVLQNSREHLIIKTGCDILGSEIKKLLEMIRREESAIESEILPEQKETLRRNKKDLQQLETRLKRSRAEIREELRALEKRKTAAIRAATMENFRDVMEDEIGLIPKQEGHRLDEDINTILEHYCEKHSEWTNQLGTSMQEEYDKQNEILQSLLSKGSGAVAFGLKNVRHLGTDVIKKGIFAGRDVLAKMGKTIKFKPWQVTKIANFASKSLPLIGIGIDIVTEVITNSVEQAKNKKFENTKRDIIKEIQTIFKVVVDRLNEDEIYFSDFAPDYSKLAEQIENDGKAIWEQEQMLKEFHAWEKKASEFDFDFCQRIYQAGEQRRK